MPRKAKASAEEKVQIVEAYLRGEMGLKSAAAKLSVVISTMELWIALYRAEGSNAFVQAKRNRCYPPEVKEAATKEYLFGKDSILSICQKYCIRSTRSLQQWIKVYNAHGDFNSRKNSGGGSCMKQGRDTTREERIQIVKDCLASGKNYGEMALKYKVIQKIAELVRDKKIDGITALRDESDRSGMRICIELRRDVNANIILNQLYKHTQLQDTFGVIMLALVDNQPKVLNLYDMLKYYLLHQEEVVTRRTQYDLNKAEERAHILEGLMIALDNIDRVIQIIRGSQNVQIAKEGLMSEFGLSEAQAQAIVDMRLRALTGLEREKLEAELKELLAKIAEYKAILSDKKKLLTVIKTEISAIADKYADERRTQIGFDEYDLSMEDLIPDEDVIIARTNLGYIKRMTPDNFKSQHRGGKGIKGMQTLEDDFIEDLFMTTSHHSLTFFTNQGRAYKLKAYEIPESGRTSRGTAIINLLQLQPEEQITAVIPVDTKHINDSDYMFMATKKGIVKKTQLKEYANIRKTGLQAINLRDDDELIEVKLTDNTKDILLVTKLGQCIRFHESDVRKTGRSSMGVIGMNLLDEDEVVGMQLDTQGDSLLIVSEKGLGKITDMNEFTVQHRGGKGIKCYKISEKTGNVVGVKAVDDTREVMLITTEGVIIQIECKDISKLGRITSGVKLINLDENVTVATIAKVSKKPENEKGEEIETENDEENTESE